MHRPQIHNSHNLTLRLHYTNDRDILNRLAEEDSQAGFIKACIRKQIANENRHKLMRDEDDIVTLYSPQHNLTVILGRDGKEYEVIGICKGEMNKYLASNYAGQFKVKI